MADYPKNKPQILLSEKEQEEFESFFLQYHPLLYHFGMNIVPQEQLVEDCIQELFIHIYEKAIILSNISNLKAYLFTALRRRVLEKKKKEYRLTSQTITKETDIQFSDEFLLIEQQDIADKQQLLNASLNDLPWRQKEAVYLKFFNGLSAKEIAEIMGITSQVVTNTVYKAIKKLKTIASNSSSIFPFFPFYLNLF